MAMQWVSVAINRPLAAWFDYSCDVPVELGARVMVPFGRGQVVGVVMRVHQQPPEGDFTVKSVTQVLDDKPLINQELQKLLAYAARYYQHPAGEVVHAALPVALRKGAENVRDLPRLFSLTDTGRTALGGSLGEKQHQVLATLAERDMSAAELREAFKANKAWLDDLLMRGWLSARECWQGVVEDERSDVPQLSAEQDTIVTTLNNAKAFSVHLLDGVTGSGKTEVYLHWLDKLLENGGQALVLVPEIGLVNAMSSALRARLRHAVVTHHSGMTDKARLDTWQAIAAGDAQVVVGTRSAIFSPFIDLRGIVVDEEHDQAYKQQDGFRYHARDMAIVRAHNNNIPIVLGSATPSLESYHKVWQGGWQYHRLAERIRADAPAKIVMVNPQEGELVGGLEKRLVRAMRATLREGKQVMLFLNRRGYAPLMYCAQCGWKSECPACDTTMTAHTHSRRLQCHHCGRQAPLPLQCPSCMSTELLMLGMGTQRLEQAVNLHFPQARVLRMDSDAFTTAKQFDEAVAKIHAGEVDIVLGTQWLSKGHHFANLHLVAVVDVDQALFSADYRSEERLAQLLVQVAGRAGRESQGEVWLQTTQPQHPVFSVLHTPYIDQAKRLYAQRRESGLPPLTAQALLMSTHRDGARAAQALQWTRSGVEQALGRDEALRWLGPAPALMPRKDGKQRQQLLLQASDKKHLQRNLPEIIAWLNAQGQALGVRVMVDVDPQGSD
ncbi:primosomal protein N' [Cardiobacteriaceae bacterium TAE3-ERU3]|nr:primosomal protein N' [Cardiobacteriaceae bacterium TAE3-ERU3]